MSALDTITPVARSAMSVRDRSDQDYISADEIGFNR